MDSHKKSPTTIVSYFHEVVGDCSLDIDRIIFYDLVHSYRFGCRPTKRYRFGQVVRIY